MDARSVIEQLALEPHPEGGWYRETWRAPALEANRGACTSILFLLEPGGRSHWHRVDATEVWLHHAGGALTLRTAAGGQVLERRLGPNILAGDAPQAVVAAGEWQSAEAMDGWVLVGCVVAPAFEFSGFEIAPPDWSPDDQSGA